MARSRILAGVLVAGAWLAMPTVAVAQDYVSTLDPPEVRGTTTERDPGDPGDPGDPTKVLGTTTSRDGGALPMTGGDIVGLAVIGAGALGMGTLLVRRGRTRSTASA